MMRRVLVAVTVTFGVILACAHATKASGQIVDNLGFKALPRAIHYDTPLVPKQSPKAVIVYGKNAPYTKTAAQTVQKAIQEWCGVALEMVDDHTVTSDQTWLLTEAYLKTPLVVLGNAQDNRAMHALGTRYLLTSNRTWPGGDRYIVRSYFEPFVADTNWILLEASNAAGMEAAVAKFRQMLQGFPKSESATVPRFRELGFVKDQWHFDGQWTPPAEYGQPGKRTAAEIAKEFKGTPAKSGSGELWEPYAMAIEYVRGGVFGRYTDNAPALPSATGDHMRIIAAMAMNGCRAVGGRVHVPREDYGTMGAITGIEAIFQSGVLDEKELNEFENFMTLSAAHPNYYWYDNIGSGNGFLNEIGDRHGATSLLINVYLLDYVRNHCRMDERTRKEIDRRYEGTLKSTACYINSYRDNFDTYELGETTMMYFYAMLYEGMPQWIANGNLRHAADLYIFISDNIVGNWGIQGCYAGLDSYIGAGCGAKSSCHGRGLVSAAAFYLDDPQYRWFSVGRTGHAEGIHGSVGTPFLGMHWEIGETTEPTRYTGVRSLPFDTRLYELAANKDNPLRWKRDYSPVPGPLPTLVDRAAFRDGFDPNDAYLLVPTMQCLLGKDGINAIQSNSIARFTDLGEIWLYTNTRTFTNWSKSVVSISNGKPYTPYACCTLEAQANLGSWSMISSKDHGVAGTDWTRTIVHLRGHYFAVLDRIEARADDEYNMVCRWRGLQPAQLDGRTWVACGSSGACMKIQATDPVMQTAENWESDGAARPFVLSQYKKDHLAKGQAQTFQNLMYVSGPSRPDEFTTRRVGRNSMLIKGKTSAGDHAALIGTGGEMPLEDFQTDAAIYCVSGDTIYLAGATTLQARIDGQMREVFHSPGPANLLLDCVSGKAQVCQSVDTPGEPKLGLDSQAGAGRTLALFDGGSLPNLTGKLRSLWDQSPSNLSAAPVEGGENANIFQALPSPNRLQRPLCRLTDFRLTASPNPVLPLSDLTDMQYGTGTACNQPTWRDTKDLEITLTFPQPTDLDRVRLVGILWDGWGRQYNARPLNKGDDFSFSLILSDDGFQKDIRKIDKPTVTFENTPMFGTIYYGIGRLPTWRIAVGQKARQIKILPREAEDKNSIVHDPGKGGLRLTEIEVYGAHEADDLGIQAFAGDVNGDGDNELVVGTTNQQLAVYDSTGKRLWSKNAYPDHVYTMACDDLDGNGKADVILYTTGEKLYRYRGDGSAMSSPADLYEAQVNDPQVGYPRTGGITAIIPWRPDPKKQKEIALLAQGEFFVTQDNKIRYGHVSESRGGTWVHGLLPDEPDMLVVCNYSLIAWSSRVDANGTRIKIKELAETGGAGAACAKSFAWARQIDAGKFRGVLAANEGGTDWYPVEAFQGAGMNPFQAKPGWHPGWGFDTGGTPVTAVLAEDIDGDGVPDVFLARKDGFVNVLKLADGSSKALLNTGQPVLGLCMLRGKDGKPRLAVATQFGVSLFGQDLKLIGRRAIPVSAFVGPAGKNKDSAYVIDSAGNVTVLTLQ